MSETQDLTKGHPTKSWQAAQQPTSEVDQLVLEDLELVRYLFLTGMVKLIKKHNKVNNRDGKTN